MASSKISELPTGTPALAPDEFIIARSGSNYKLTVSDITDFIAAGALVTTDLADIDNTSPTITGQLLIFNSVTGKYETTLILDGGSF